MRHGLQALTAWRIGAVLPILVCLGVAGCGNWRERAVSDAESKIRTILDDPAAQFYRVDVTGNSSTGQTCGEVTVKPGGSAWPQTHRFIVYIDGTAGPFIEGGNGPQHVGAARFDLAWQYDCVKEGYRG